MPRFRVQTARERLSAQVRAELERAAGDNLLVSRVEEAELNGDLRIAAEAARAAKGPGARISVRDVLDVSVRVGPAKLESGALQPA